MFKLNLFLTRLKFRDTNNNKNNYNDKKNAQEQRRIITQHCYKMLIWAKYLIKQYPMYKRHVYNQIGVISYCIGM